MHPRRVAVAHKAVHDDAQREARVERRLADRGQVIVGERLLVEPVSARSAEEQELGANVSRRVGQNDADVVERRLVAEAADLIVEAHLPRSVVDERNGRCRF